MHTIYLPKNIPAYFYIHCKSKRCFHSCFITSYGTSFALLQKLQRLQLNWFEYKYQILESTCCTGSLQEGLETKNSRNEYLIKNHNRGRCCPIKIFFQGTGQDRDGKGKDGRTKIKRRQRNDRHILLR